MAWLIISPILAVVLLLIVLCLWWVLSDDGSDHVHDLDGRALADDALLRTDAEFGSVGSRWSTPLADSRRNRRLADNWSKRPELQKPEEEIELPGSNLT